MCQQDQACQKPEELKDKPENCSPEQIKKCHGEAIGHPCLSSAENQEIPRDKAEYGGGNPFPRNTRPGGLQTPPGSP